MSPHAALAVVVGLALLAPVTILLAPGRAVAAIAGAGLALLGTAGVACGVVVLFHGFPRLAIRWLLPLSGVLLAGHAISAGFLVITGGVGVASGIYTVGYAAHGHASRTTLAVLPAFLGAMLVVPLAGSVPTFLAAWELMALASLVLVLAEHHAEEPRRAGLTYAVMTELGFLAIFLGLVVFAGAAHGKTFADLATAAARLPASTRTAIFALTLLGFGSKAGLIPVHAWLPRAHPAAPSPASALMSAAMVNLGIYGIVRVDIVLLGPGPTWWALVLLALGGATAIYAVLQACVEVDLKRLLAYSTSENMGLVCLALGAGMLFTDVGARVVALIAVTAALLHLVNHAAFKTTGFLAAGSVASVTGERDLDALGGLARRMPATTWLFGVAALGASGLPLGCGFVSEWLLLQSLIHAPATAGATVALVAPLAVGTVALTAGLGVAAMVKAFGVGFLARPRGPGAAGAREARLSMTLGTGLAGAACLVLAVAPVVAAPGVLRALRAFPADHGKPALAQLGLLLRLPGIPGSMSPGLLAVAVVGGVALVLAAAQASAGRQLATARPAVWSCGSGPLTPRMQYTATSFAEPLQRVFDDVLRPERDVLVSHYAESAYLVEKVTYRLRFSDALEVRLYDPILRALGATARLVRRAHSGSVHAYLAAAAGALVVALIVAR